MTAAQLDNGAARSGRYFHLFVYDRAPEALGSTDIPEECERVATRAVAGTLYDVDGAYPALVLAGTGQIEGEVWRCPVELLPEFDRDERVSAGLFRRVGVQVEEYACWVYVAGPKLVRWLVPGRRVDSKVGRATEA